MSEERKKWPEQGQLRLAADRKARGGAKGASAERAVAERQIPVFEDLPAFEEEDEVHGLPGRSRGWRSTSARSPASSSASWPPGCARSGGTSGCAASGW